MDTDKVSFTLPPRKSVRICALEGSVKAIRGRATIVKKELCVTDTPIPKFIKPKVRDDIKPTREQQDILDNLPDIDRIKEDIKIDFVLPKFDMEKMKSEITNIITDDILEECIIIIIDKCISESSYIDLFLVNILSFLLIWIVNVLFRILIVLELFSSRLFRKRLLIISFLNSGII